MKVQNTKSVCCCNGPVSHCNATQKKTTTSKSKVKRFFNSIYSIIVSLFIALFPKCPMCWAAYMSIFGSYSIAKLPYLPWLMPIFMGLLGVHLFLLFKNIKNKGKLPFIISIAGAAIIIIGKQLLPDLNFILITGMLLIMIGSFWNNFSFQLTQFAKTN